MHVAELETGMPDWDGRKTGTEIVGTEREDSVKRRGVLSLEGKTCGCWTKFLLNIIMTDRGIRPEYKAGHSEYFPNMLRCYLH